MFRNLYIDVGLPRWLSGKESTSQANMPALSLCQEDPLEKEMTTHTSILAWGIPLTEEPSGLELMASQRVGHNIETKQRHVM